MALRPERDRRTLQRALLHAKCPGRTANGKYHVPAWQKFLDEVGPIGHLDAKETRREPDGIERKLKEAKVRTELADAERRERENRIAAGLVIEKEQARKDIAVLFHEVKLRLMRLPWQVVPMIVAKRDVDAGVELLTERLNTVLGTLVVENVATVSDGKKK